MVKKLKTKPLVQANLTQDFVCKMMTGLGYKLPKNKPARWFVDTHVEGCSFLDDGTFASSNVGESGCNCIGESKDDFFYRHGEKTYTSQQQRQ